MFELNRIGHKRKEMNIH